MPPLQTRFPLGKTQIPAVGFGTYLISNDDAAQTVAEAISIGYRHIDTAAGYQNEAGVGAGIDHGLALAGIDRDDLFVTTKLWPGNANWGDPPKGYDETRAAFEASRAALGLEVIDLYLIHAPSGGEKRVEEWRALCDLKSEGAIRAIGVSNFTRDHIEEIRAAGPPMPEANQVELHPWSQKPDLVAYLRAEGILPIAYSSLVPLSTWRTKPGQESAKTDQMKSDGQSDTSPFRHMAAKYGVTEAQLLLKWGVQNGFPVLPKSMSPDRMRQNLDLAGFDIDPGDMADIAGMDRGDGVAWAIGDPSKLG
ncbi:aldo/keto reductase [Nioella sp.]|uniref:aldo/keto reductase n=1 Tax=Nioella sp. TaxID=1912091 RepID=UPI003514BCEE